MDTAVDAAVIRSGATSFPNRGADRGSTHCIIIESPWLDHGAMDTAVDAAVIRF